MGHVTMALNRFEKDGKDAQGNPISGRFGVFQMFTSKDKLNEVARLNNSVDPRIKDKAVNWSINEFMRIYQNEVIDLDLIQANPAFKLTYAVDPKTNRPQFNLRYAVKPVGAISDTGEALDYKYAVNQRDFKHYTQIVENLNKGLDGMANVGELAGFKPSEFVLQQLIQRGYTPAPGSEAEKLYKTMVLNVREEAAQNAPTSQNKARGSVKTDRGRGSTPPETSPTRNFGPEDTNMTLGDWLADPARATRRVKTQSIKKPAPKPVEGDILGVEVIDNPQGLSPRQLDEQLKRNR